MVCVSWSKFTSTRDYIIFLSINKLQIFSVYIFYLNLLILFVLYNIKGTTNCRLRAKFRPTDGAASSKPTRKYTRQTWSTMSNGSRGTRKSVRAVRAFACGPWPMALNGTRRVGQTERKRMRRSFVLLSKFRIEMIDCCWGENDEMRSDLGFGVLYCMENFFLVFDCCSYFSYFNCQSILSYSLYMN